MAKLIGEIADRRLSGLLCLHRDETAKTIYFESGAPVFAASDVTNEQLEYRLAQDGLVDTDAIEGARGNSLTTEELGSNLVEAGALSQEAMERSIRDLAADIILSVFEWQQGDYIFYEDSDPGVSTKLDWTPAECILAASQRAEKSDSSVAMVPAEARLVQTGVSRDSIEGAARLTFLETFVLSAIVTPTPVSEVATLIGFPEAETQVAIGVLLKLRLLKLEGENNSVSHNQAQESDEPADQLADATAAHVADDTSSERPVEVAAEPELSSPITIASDYGVPRAGTESDSITRVVPADGLLVQTNASLDSNQSGHTLSSLECFVLSLIGAPMLVRDVATLTGLPEAETQGAIRVLLKLGLLRLEGERQEVICDLAPEHTEPIDQIAVSDQQTTAAASAQRPVEVAQQLVKETSTESPVEAAAEHPSDLTSAQQAVDDRSPEPPGEAAWDHPFDLTSAQPASTDHDVAPGAAESDSITPAVPPDGRLVQAHANPDSIPGGVALSSLECFVLSVIAAPTMVRDVAALTGLQDTETQNVICALLKSGLIKLEDEVESVNDKVTEQTEPANKPAGSHSTRHSSEDMAAEPPFEVAADKEPILSSLPSIHPATDKNVVPESSESDVMTRLAATNSRLVQTNVSPESISSAVALTSLEAFVLSSVVAPTRACDIATSAGLPEPDTQEAIRALLKHGLLRLEDVTTNHEDCSENGERASQQAAECVASHRLVGDSSEETSVEWAVEMVAARLKATASSDYYRVLGVARIAPTIRIATSYQELKEKLESFLTRWPENGELTHNVGSLIAKIDEAYLTLSDPEKRRAYDRPAGVAAGRKPPKKGKALKSTIVPAGPASSGHEFTPAPFSVSFDPDVKPQGTASIKNAPTYDPVAVAQDHFKKGRGRFDRSDFHAAVHHFREAARLDPSKSDHHYYLAVTLSILAQARHERHSHTHDIGSHVTCTLGGGLARNPRLRREAEQHLLKALELDRKNLDIPLRLARLYQDAGIQKKANHYFLETLMLDPSNAAALRELGLAEQAKERRTAKEKRTAPEPARRSNPRKSDSSVFVIDEADL